MFEFDAHRRQAADALFLERLDAFMERSLVEMKAFSDRENLSLEETRLHVAEWHSKYLFQSQMSAPDWSSRISPIERQAYIRSSLCDISRLLENLQALSGVHSFVLAVDPTEPAADGFLGGSLLGRYFWRNLRGGSDAGAKSFKAYCVKESEPSASSAQSSLTPAQILKAELYEKVRNALRYASGIKTAEMKWSQPDKLVDSYGVSLVGWPTSVPYQNPSTMKSNQKKEVLKSLDDGVMKFVKVYQTDAPLVVPAGDEDPDDYSWALNEPLSASQRPRLSKTPEGTIQDSEGIQTYHLGNDDHGPRKRLKAE